MTGFAESQHSMSECLFEQPEIIGILHVGFDTMWGYGDAKAKTLIKARR
jgi:hypothetical protein